jgi:O-antigen ligase
MLLQGEPAVGIIQPLRVRHIQAYHLCDRLTELLIYFMLVFGPWAFGTTQMWSIWVMNVCGYTLSLLLLIKLRIHSRNGYPQDQWVCEQSNSARTPCTDYEGSRTTHHAPRTIPRTPPFVLSRGALTQGLAIVSLSILCYCLIAAANARATFNPSAQTFEYHDCIRWLPHSLESRSSWAVFWNYLALASSFWAICNWLYGRTAAEEQANRLSAKSRQETKVTLKLPVRLHRLMLVLLISGTLLGLEGIAQRMLDSPKLLFLVKPEIHQNAQTQFASYAYRANGAQYFNLIWPACLGYWWLLQRFDRGTPVGKYAVLACVGIMAACPFISSARGATLVDLVMLAAAAVVVLVSPTIASVQYRSTGKWRTGRPVAVFLAIVLALGLGLGRKQLRPGLDEFKAGIEDREQICARALPMARDYPIFGIGPGAFERVFQLYRITEDAYWPAQLHNDWLETRITFGIVGSLLIGLAFLTVLVRWLAPGGIPAPTPFILLLWLSLAGCLVQARWDFPLQVYSILFVFLVLCSVLFNHSREW